MPSKRTIVCNDHLVFSEMHSEAEIRAQWANGWQQHSTNGVNVYLVDGDHDSMMRKENIPELKKIFATILASSDQTQKEKNK